MPGTAVDTNVVIAALLSWHEHHLDAFNAVNSILEDGDDALILPAPVLIEAYSVMTRLPAPHRLRPADAFLFLTERFVKLLVLSN